MKSLKSYVTNPAQIRKALVALVSCVLLGVGAHVLPNVVGNWIQVLQPLLVAYGVFQSPENAPAPAEPAAPVAPPAA